MNLYRFRIFKHSLKAGVPSEGKQASPDEMVRKVINLLSLTHTHKHTHTEHDQNLQEDQREQSLWDKQVTTAETVCELFNSNKNRYERFYILMGYR